MERVQFGFYAALGTVRRVCHYLPFIIPKTPILSKHIHLELAHFLDAKVHFTKIKKG
jgi:hypothetical protein